MRRRPLVCEPNRRVLAGLMILVFLAGWFGYATYLYSNQIMVITIEGVIDDFQAATRALHQAKVDRNVRAVVLYLNTPGGYVSPCVEIASYIREVAKVKPVIASMGPLCASGGYYIASFATYIFAHENTITGGIGVLVIWLDLSEYYEKQGIKVWVWTTGAAKDYGAEWRSPTEEERRSIQREVDAIFQRLLGDIKANRRLSDDIINLIKDGSTFLGKTAVERGLADRVGGVIDAKTYAAEKAGVWRFLIVTPDLDERQKFLKALL